MQYLWSMFRDYDGWVVIHTFAPYAIAMAWQSRMAGLLAAYLYETLTLVLFFGFGYNIGYTGAMEGLVQDPVLALIGVVLASTSLESTSRDRKHYETIALVAIVATLFFLGLPAASKRYMEVMNFGGLLPVIWIFARKVEGRLWLRNSNALDAVRIYGLLCMANLGSHLTNSSTFLWMLAVVVVPEILIARLTAENQEATASDH